MSEEFLKQTIKFKKKPAKMGADHCFWIPRSFIKNGLIDVTKTYEVYLKEVPEEKDPGKNPEDDQP
ncbi:MAG: hypothetical protein Q6365_007630 [Candidatus Sigynarchaeota archaeon]